LRESLQEEISQLIDDNKKLLLINKQLEEHNKMLQKTIDELTKGKLIEDNEKEKPKSELNIRVEADVRFKQIQNIDFIID